MSWSAGSRLEEKIRERVANVVLFELQDPRICLVTVTRVRVAKDLSACKVYYTVLGTDAERSKTAHALADAAGYVRRELARVLRTRTTPPIEFVYDDSVEGGMRVGNLLRKLKNERDVAEGTATDADAVDSGLEMAAAAGPDNEGATMSSTEQIRTRVAASLAEIRARIEFDDDETLRRQRIEEVMDAVIDDAIDLLDRMGWTDPANEISCVSSIPTRFKAILDLVGDRAAELQREASDQGLAEQCGVTVGLVKEVGRIAGLLD